MTERFDRIPLARIKVGDRFRKNLGNLESLVASIKEVGLLQPILVDLNYRIIAGHRRFEAWKIAKSGNPIPAIKIDSLDDAHDRLVAERDENTCREDMAASEIYELGKAIEKLEKTKAKARQGSRTDLATSVSMEPEVVEGDTSTKVGASIGISRAQWNRLKVLGDAATAGDERAARDLESIDKGEKTIRGAHRELRERTPPKAPREKTALPTNVGDVRTITKRRSAAAVLDRVAEQLSHYAAELDGIDVSQVPSDRAEACAESLSRFRSVLSRTINQLRSVA